LVEQGCHVQAVLDAEGDTLATALVSLLQFTGKCLRRDLPDRADRDAGTVHRDIGHGGLLYVIVPGKPEPANASAENGAAVGAGAAAPGAGSGIQAGG